MIRFAAFVEYSGGATLEPGHTIWSKMTLNEHSDRFNSCLMIVHFEWLRWKRILTQRRCMFRKAVELNCVAVEPMILVVGNNRRPRRSLFVAFSLDASAIVTENPVNNDDWQSTRFRRPELQRQLYRNTRSVAWPRWIVPNFWLEHSWWPMGSAASSIYFDDCRAGPHHDKFRQSVRRIIDRNGELNGLSLCPTCTQPISCWCWCHRSMIASSDAICWLLVCRESFRWTRARARIVLRVCTKRSHNLFSSVVQTGDAAVTTSFRSGLYRSLKFLFV